MSTIRRQIAIDASPRTIWQSLTTVDGLKRWLADDARLEPRAGGRVVLRVRGLEGEDVGLLHVFRPTGRMEIMWDKQAPGEWRGTHVSFQVARDVAESLVHVQHAGAMFEDDGTRARFDAFWRDALSRLQADLEKDLARPAPKRV